MARKARQELLDDSGQDRGHGLPRSVATGFCPDPGLHGVAIPALFPPLCPPSVLDGISLTLTLTLVGLTGLARGALRTICIRLSKRVVSNLLERRGMVRPGPPPPLADCCSHGCWSDITPGVFLRLLVGVSRGLVGSELWLTHVCSSIGTNSDLQKRGVLRETAPRLAMMVGSRGTA